METKLYWALDLAYCGNNPLDEDEQYEYIMDQLTDALDIARNHLSSMDISVELLDEEIK